MIMRCICCTALVWVAGLLPVQGQEAVSSTQPGQGKIALDEAPPPSVLAPPTVAAHFLAWFVTASVLAACNLFHSLLQHLVGNATTLQSIRKAACSVLIKLSLVAP